MTAALAAIDGGSTSGYSSQPKGLDKVRVKECKSNLVWRWLRARRLAQRVRRRPAQQAAQSRDLILQYTGLSA